MVVGKALVEVEAGLDADAAPEAMLAVLDAEADGGLGPFVKDTLGAGFFCGELELLGSAKSVLELLGLGRDFVSSLLFGSSSPERVSSRFCPGLVFESSDVSVVGRHSKPEP